MRLLETVSSSLYPVWLLSWNFLTHLGWLSPTVLYPFSQPYSISKQTWKKWFPAIRNTLFSHLSNLCNDTGEEKWFSIENNNWSTLKIFKKLEGTVSISRILLITVCKPSLLLGNLKVWALHSPRHPSVCSFLTESTWVWGRKRFLLHLAHHALFWEGSVKTEMTPSGYFPFIEMKAGLIYRISSSGE